jgi:hypothetical protein
LGCLELPTLCVVCDPSSLLPLYGLLACLSVLYSGLEELPLRLIGQNGRTFFGLAVPDYLESGRDVAGRSLKAMAGALVTGGCDQTVGH